MWTCGAKYSHRRAPLACTPLNEPGHARNHPETLRTEISCLEHTAQVKIAHLGVGTSGRHGAIHWESFVWIPHVMQYMCSHHEVGHLCSVGDEVFTLRTSPAITFPKQELHPPVTVIVSTRPY